MKQIFQMIAKTLKIMNRPQKVLGVLVFLLTCIGSILECLGVSVIIPLVTVIQSPDSIMGSEIVRGNRWLSGLSYFQMVVIVCGGVIILYIAKNLFFIFLSWVRIKYSCKVERETSIKILTSYLNRGYQFIMNMNYGEFSRGMTGDPAAVNTVISSVSRLTAEALTIFLICCFMFITDWQLALVMLALALICLLLIYLIFRKQMYEAGKQIRALSAKTGQTVSQIFQGAKDVLLMRKQAHFIYEFEEERIETQKQQCRQNVGAESPAYIIEGICVSGLMLSVGIRIISGTDSSDFFAVLATFAVGAFRILPSLGKMSSAINTLTNSISSVDALYEQVMQADQYAKEHPELLVNYEMEEKDQRLINRGRKNRAVDSSIKYDMEPAFQNFIELKNVCFQYRTELGYVLKDVNLKINKGQSVAIIGASGAGKSTLVDVLLGLLEPQEGAIYLDGKKITEDLDKWARTIGYVPQTINLASTSIRKNVAFGEREEDISDERIYEVLEEAEMKTFINSLPEGIETMAGDRGVRLSGGQRQRIAIARALYHNPELLVLDEATSALDNDTEAAIMSAIETLQGKITMIIVAHRLTTVRNCDAIYEVKEGKLILRDKSEIFKN